MQCARLRYMLYRFGTSPWKFIDLFCQIRPSAFLYSSSLFHLALRSSSSLFCPFFDLVFRKLEENDCVAPSWCWVMTAHSFVVVASPYTTTRSRADGHQLFFSPSFNVCSISPVLDLSSLLSSYTFIISIQLIRSLRWENGVPHRKNILGNCVQRTSPPSIRTLLRRNSSEKEIFQRDQPRRFSQDFIYEYFSPF